MQNRTLDHSFQIRAIQDPIGASPTAQDPINAAPKENTSSGEGKLAEELEVDFIVEERHAKAKPFRVRWKGYTSDDDTWQTSESLQDCAALDRWFAKKPDCILEQRKSKTSKYSFLVSWKGYGPESNSWELIEVLSGSTALDKWLNNRQGVAARCEYEVGRDLAIKRNKVSVAMPQACKLDTSLLPQAVIESLDFVSLRVVPPTTAPPKVGGAEGNPTSNVGQPVSMVRPRRGIGCTDSLFGLGDALAPLGEGDCVRALFKHNGGGLRRRCPGTITKVHDDGTYDILYDDAQRECKKPRKYIEKKPNPK